MYSIIINIESVPENMVKKLYRIEIGQNVIEKRGEISPEILSISHVFFL